MKKVVLWAVKKGALDWEEVVITETDDSVKLENAKDWAILNGFDRLRTMTLDDGYPDFIGTIQAK